jgi:Flp pilus assembly protein TadD
MFAFNSRTRVGRVVTHRWKFARLLGACLALTLGACASTDVQTFSLPDSTLPQAKKPVEEAQLQFSEGNFGLAVDSYAKTVETDPKNPEAWLGLAASYDQVGRFDEADKAYAKVQELIGATPSVLNNLGYSYMLRGKLDQSRDALLAAHRADPGNPYILNNIDMLNQKLASLGRQPVALN